MWFIRQQQWEGGPEAFANARTTLAHSQPQAVCVAQQMLPMWESHEYLMRQARTHSLHHTFSLIHVINQSSNWELYVRWLSVSVCQIHDCYLQNSVLLFVIPLVLAPCRCIDGSLSVLEGLYYQLVLLRLFISFLNTSNINWVCLYDREVFMEWY